MKTLIISVTAGEGHNASAKAIKEVYDLNGEYSEIADGLSYISPLLSKFIGFSHIVIYRHFPKLFNFGYTQSEKKPKLFSKGSLIYKILKLGTKKLYNHIKSGEFDTVICTHPFAGIILTEVIEKYSISLKTGFVATDFTCSPSTRECNLDRFFIPDVKLIDDFNKGLITPDKIVPVGIPIRQKFYSKTDKIKAKNALGIESDKKHIVVMCGSMGCGPLAQLSVNFAASMTDCEFSIICGTNKKLKKSLDKKAKAFKNLHIHGFINDMPLVLDSADLYLTKPGGLSTSEAVAKEIPMLFVNTVAACETYNLKHYLSYEVAESGKNVRELTEKCKNIINDDNKLDTFKANLKKINKANSAMKIRETMENLEK